MRTQRNSGTKTYQVVYLDGFDSLEKAIDEARSMHGDEHLKNFAIVELDPKTGTLSVIADRDTLDRAFTREQEAADEAEEREERYARRYGRESDGSAYGVDNSWFL